MSNAHSTPKSQTAHSGASRASHTPGPWAVTIKQDRTMMIAAPAGHYVAKVVGSTAMGDMRERFAADAARRSSSRISRRGACLGR